MHNSKKEYTQRLDFLDQPKVHVWSVDVNKSAGRYEYVLVILSPENRVLDVLHFQAAMYLRPFVNGWYEQRLRSIKPGTSVEDIYRLLGKTVPVEYSQDKTGKWILTFSYQGAGPEFWIYEVDPVSGKVVNVWVSTM